MTDVIMVKLDQMGKKLDDIKAISEDNRRALRGYDDKPGLVGRVGAVEDSLDKLEEKSNRNDVIVGAGTIVGSVIGFIFGQK